jgi:hypothetical protein
MIFINKNVKICNRKFMVCILHLITANMKKWGGWDGRYMQHMWGNKKYMENCGMDKLD